MICCAILTHFLLFLQLTVTGNKALGDVKVTMERGVLRDAYIRQETFRRVTIDSMKLELDEMVVQNCSIETKPFRVTDDTEFYYTNKYIEVDV